MTKTIRRLSAVMFAAASAAVLVTSAAGSAGASTSLTAVAHVTNHGDSGNGGGTCDGTDGSGCWATENYTLTTSVQRADNKTYDPAANCGTASTDTGKCYKWVGTMTFSNGTFTTRQGAGSPRKGTTMDDAATGPFSGWVHNIVFYSSWKGVYADQIRVPKNHSDLGTKGAGDRSIPNWVKLFFGSQASVNVADFGDGTVSTYSFTYNLPFGADTSCPRVASRWVDAVPATNDGSAVTAGDILAPDQADGC